MSLVVRKPTRSDTNQAVQPQKMARGLKFQIYEEEGLYYLCSENKGADQFRGLPAKLICVFVFDNAKSPFSHDAAQMLIYRFKHFSIKLVLWGTQQNHLVETESHH